MKRALTLLLALTLVLAACGRGATGPVVDAAPRLVEGTTLAALLDDLAERYALPAPLLLDEELMTRLLDIPAELRVEYRGYISMEPQAPDQLVGVRAAPRRAEEVAKLLEARRAWVASSLAEAPGWEAEKARAGQVFFMGDYVFLLVGGRTGMSPAAEAAEMLRIIQDQFEK